MCETASSRLRSPAIEPNDEITSDAAAVPSSTARPISHPLRSPTIVPATTASPQPVESTTFDSIAGTEDSPSGPKILAPSAPQVTTIVFAPRSRSSPSPVARILLAGDLRELVVVGEEVVDVREGGLEEDRERPVS